ncbi:MAG: hypothetical protein LBQ34_02870 [Alphaproteobacteria bacterium]|jgi:hypothetical protein|nr:hypothetical protein [Alphaproteobacteria bacterium]
MENNTTKINYHFYLLVIKFNKVNKTMYLSILLIIFLCVIVFLLINLDINFLDIRKNFKNHKYNKYNILMAVCIFIFIIYLTESLLYSIFDIEEWIFFGNIRHQFFNSDDENYKGKYPLLYCLAAVMAGLIAIITITLSFKRYRQTEKHNLEIFFKETISLLGNNSSATRMGAVHTLIDIAEKDHVNYAKRINTILCQHIVDRSNEEYYKYLNSNNVNKNDIRILERVLLLRKFCLLEEDKIAQDSNLIKEYNRYKNVIKYLESFYSSNEVQDLINLVFNCCLFENMDSNINGAKLFNIKLIANNLKMVRFEYCFFDNIVIKSEDIDDISFKQTSISRMTIDGKNLNKIEFNESIIKNTHFAKLKDRNSISSKSFIGFDKNSCVIGCRFDQLLEDNFVNFDKRPTCNFIFFTSLHNQENTNINRDLLGILNNVYLNIGKETVHNSNKKIKLIDFTDNNYGNSDFAIALKKHIDSFDKKLKNNINNTKPNKK